LKIDAQQVKDPSQSQSVLRAITGDYALTILQYAVINRDRELVELLAMTTDTSEFNMSLATTTTPESFAESSHLPTGIHPLLLLFLKSFQALHASHKKYDVRSKCYNDPNPFFKFAVQGKSSQQYSRQIGT
jgi:hypothetical protein